MPSQVIFEERLIYLTEKRQAFTFNQTPKAMLTKNAIIWYADGNKHQLSLDDVVGSTGDHETIAAMGFDLVFHCKPAAAAHWQFS